MQNFEAFLLDLEKLISYKTVESTPEKNAPFGLESANCLQFFLQRAKEMGFTTVNYDNYAGEVIFGDGEEIGVIGHLDVVPVGIGWNTDPFKLTLTDGALYGRGVVDNKTPLLICLYILNELKNSNLKINKKVRLIAGCNEESGWRDVEYMKSKTNFPELGFSPDGNFPVSYAEKGVLKLSFELPTFNDFYNLKGGVAVNAVCDLATVCVKERAIDLDLLSKYNLTIKDGVITSVGKAAHGSAPQLGVNAFKPIFEYMLEKGEKVKDILDYLFYDKLGVFTMKNEQGNVTLSPDIIVNENGKSYIVCDCRIPAPFLESDVLEKVKLFNIPFKSHSSHPPFMIEKDNALVITLSNAYNEVTGENTTPASLGGSTFARAFNKGCAFGPEFEGYEYRIHDANENLPLNHLERMYQIYKKAIFDILTK